MKLLDKMNKYKTMRSYCLKRKTNTESINPRVSKLAIIKQCYYQSVLCVVLKNQDLSKNKTEMNYKVV